MYAAAAAAQLGAPHPLRRAATRTDLDALIAMVPPKYYFPPDPDEMAKVWPGTLPQSHDAALGSSRFWRPPVCLLLCVRRSFKST